MADFNKLCLGRLCGEGSAVRQNPGGFCYGLPPCKGSTRPRALLLRMAVPPSQAIGSYLASGSEEECAALAPDIPQAYPEHPVLQDVGELTLPPAGDPQGTT